MFVQGWQRRLATAIAVAAGLSTHAVSAQEPSGLYYVQVQDANGQNAGALTDPGPAPTPAADAATDAAPMRDEPASTAPSAMAPPVMAYDDGQAYAAAPCACCNSTCCTKKKKEAATAAMKGAYKGVFYANDFSYLNDPCYDGPSFFGDSLKGLLGGKLDIGGEARVRYHNENGFRGRVPGLNSGPGNASSGLGLTGNDDQFWLTRYRMFANYRINDIFRFYGEYLYADSGGEDFNNRPIEENRGEAQNLFIDAKLLEGLNLRVGRQEILLGAQRLVSPLDWANTRRTFDGVRLTNTSDKVTTDAFYLNPVNRNFANEDRWDSTNDDVHFFGTYFSVTDTPFGTWEPYYIGLVNDAADFSYHTIGSRWVGKTDNGWLYEYEGGTQFGENSPGFGDHSAAFLVGGLGRQLQLGDWKPTFWMWYDWASGGDDFPGARGDDGFDHYFPLAHKYNGFMDLFGRRNLHDVNAQFITPILGSKVKLLLWYHYFFLDEQTTPYDVVMNPYNRATVAGDKELGHEIDVLFQIAVTPRQSALVGYSHFAAGDYYDTTAGVPNQDADFFYFQYQMRF